MGWILTWALKILKISTLIGFFCKMYITFDLWKYRGVIFHDNKGRWKIWRKTDFWFEKWHEEFSNFLPQHSKVSKFWLWWDLFMQIIKFTSLKFKGELCFVAIKNDAECEEELTCRFKIDTTLWWILTRALKCLKHLH